MIVTTNLIDDDATKMKLAGLAKELMSRGDSIAADRLTNLIAAINGAPEASPEDWVAANIQRIINPDAIVEGLKGRAVPDRWVRWLELARNSLVLLPLILTWLGIWQATSAYDALLKTNASLNGQPFLYLWQQGFNGHIFSLFILSNLALTDFGLLSLIFILTAIVSWQYNVINTQTEKEAELLRESLAHALGDAALCLSRADRLRREIQPKNIQDVASYLFQFVQQFQQIAKQFLTELEEERKQRGDLKSFTTALEKITTDLVNATDLMSKVNTELTKTTRDVLSAVKDIPQMVIEAGKAVGYLGAMGVSLDAFVKDQRKWEQDVQDTLSLKLGELAAQTSTSLGQLIAEQQNMNSGLLDAVDSLEDSLDALKPVFHGLDDTAKEQIRTLESVQAQQSAQQELTNQMKAITGDMRKILQELESAGPELQSMSRDLANMVATLRNIPGVLTTEMFEPIKRYSSAANDVVVGAKVLEGAARSLTNAANKLDGRLGS
jgi:methyl-accepting chemotaxis protein